MMQEFDKIIHERTKLMILTYLAGNEKKEVSFNELQEKLDLTPGNLSVQLKKLKTAGYVQIQKTFRDNKPYTTASVTAKGKKNFIAYLDEMETIIKQFKR